MYMHVFLIALYHTIMESSSLYSKWSLGKNIFSFFDCQTAGSVSGRPSCTCDLPFYRASMTDSIFVASDIDVNVDPTDM
jgi:hypothetical protein